MYIIDQRVVGTIPGDKIKDTDYLIISISLNFLWQLLSNLLFE